MVCVTRVKLMFTKRLGRFRLGASTPDHPGRNYLGGHNLNYFEHWGSFWHEFRQAMFFLMLDDFLVIAFIYFRTLLLFWQHVDIIFLTFSFPGFPPSLCHETVKTTSDFAKRKKREILKNNLAEPRFQPWTSQLSGRRSTPRPRRPS